MSMTELTLVNASAGERTQTWNQEKGESFDLEYKRGYGMILNSDLKRYTFHVHTSAAQMVLLEIIWSRHAPQWDIHASAEFYVGWAPDGAINIRCVI